MEGKRNAHTHTHVYICTFLLPIKKTFLSGWGETASHWANQFLEVS